MDEENEEETITNNAVVNEFVNGSDNAVEAEENHADTVENAAETENSISDNAVESTVDNESTMPVEEEENDVEFPDELEADLEEEIEDDLEEDYEEESNDEDWDEDEDEFDFPEDEEDEDILGSYSEDEQSDQQPLSEAINDATNDSAKNLDTLKDLGELVIDFLDDSKAQLCSAISGQAPSQYASGQKLNKALLKAFVAYMDSQEVKAPTPLGTLLLTLALWGLPALGTAYFHRKKAQKARKKKAQEAAVQEIEQEEEEQEVPGEAKSDTPTSESIDYTQTKEYKDKRRLFDLHAKTGCYSRDLTGRFAKSSLAGEKPSTELQALLDQGFDNVKIRSILYPK